MATNVRCLWTTEGVKTLFGSCKPEDERAAEDATALVESHTNQFFIRREVTATRRYRIEACGVYVPGAWQPAVSIERVQVAADVETFRGPQVDWPDVDGWHYLDYRRAVVLPRFHGELRARDIPGEPVLENVRLTGTHGILSGQIGADLVIPAESFEYSDLIGATGDLAKIISGRRRTGQRQGVDSLSGGGASISWGEWPQHVRRAIMKHTRASVGTTRG